jgi:hypothetical protein
MKLRKALIIEMIDTGFAGDLLFMLTTNGIESNTDSWSEEDMDDWFNYSIKRNLI